MQLRMKSGQVFMEALNDPLLQTSGGKLKDDLYCADDDKALKRLLDRLDELNGADLETRLIDSGDASTKMIYQAQFDRFLKAVGTPVTDYIPLQRIAGFMSL